MRPCLPGQGLYSLGYIYDITMDSIHIYPSHRYGISMLKRYFRFLPTIPKSNIKIVERGTIDIANTQIRR